MGGPPRSHFDTGRCLLKSVLDGRKFIGTRFQAGKCEDSIAIRDSGTIRAFSQIMRHDLHFRDRLPGGGIASNAARQSRRYLSE